MQAERIRIQSGRSYELHMAIFMCKYLQRMHDSIITRCSQIDASDKQRYGKLQSQLRLLIDSVMLSGGEKKEEIKFQEADVVEEPFIDVLTCIMAYLEPIVSLAKYFEAEKIALESRIKDLVQEENVDIDEVEVEGKKLRIRIQIYMMIARLQVIFTQLNLKDIKDQIVQSEADDQSRDNINHDGYLQHQIPKRSLFEQIFVDKRQTEKVELVLDFVYSNLKSTFKGLILNLNLYNINLHFKSIMLEQRHNQDDDAPETILAMKQLVKELQLKDLNEDFNGKVSFEKKVQDMITHLLNLNKMNVPSLKSKNVISNLNLFK